MSTMLDRLLVGLLLALPRALAQDSQPAALPTVTLKPGVLVGTTTSVPSATAAVHKFLGVPFADSPPKRFEPPTPPQPWDGPRDAKNFSAACIQQFNYPEEVRQVTMAALNNPGGPPPREDEDCLYLSVYAPSTPAPPGGRAVLFWLYGGSYQFGSAVQGLTDGSSLAAHQDVIVVTPNYRTNVFGFPGAPNLPADKNNVAFLDQRLALQWTQDHISAFGGDPSKVTLFGESAGAGAVDRLLGAPPPGQLPFRAAILQSSQATYGANAYTNSSVARASWATLAEQLNCTAGRAQDDNAVYACVQSAPAPAIKSILEHGSLAFPPLSDDSTSLYPRAAIGAFEGRRAARVPILEGTNADEGTLFQLGVTNYTAYLQTYFAGNKTLQDAIMAAYPAANDSNAMAAIARSFGDAYYTCPMSAHAGLATRTGRAVWRYHFEAVFANTNPLAGAGVQLGAFHSSEVPLIWGTYAQRGATAQQRELAAYMQAAWATFAKDPTTGPGWEAYAECGRVAALGRDGGTGATMVDAAREADLHCGLFEGVNLGEYRQPNW